MTASRAKRAPRLLAIAACSIAAGMAALLGCTALVPVQPTIGLPAGPLDPPVAGTLLWIGVGIALSSFSTNEPGRAVLTFDHSAMIAATILGGPTAAAWVALLGSTEFRELDGVRRGRIPWWGVLTTHCQLVLAWTVGALVMAAVGGPFIAEPTLRSLFGAAAGVGVGLSLNLLLAGLLVSARTGTPMRDALGLPAVDTAAVYGADAVMSWLVAIVYAAGAWWTALLVAVVDFAAGRSVARHRASWLLGRHPLTDLPNATGLGQRVHQLRRSSASGLAVFYLDLDGFKRVNDEHGHGAGDEVLRVTGRRLADVCRDRDFLSHLHGDEFVVVATGVDTQAAADALASRLVAAVEPPIEVGGAVVSVSATVGVRLVADATALDDAVRDADSRMNGAKAAKALALGRARRAG